MEVAERRVGISDKQASEELNCRVQQVNGEYCQSAFKFDP
jgi:hypothetical protein